MRYKRSPNLRFYAIFALGIEKTQLKILLHFFENQFYYITESLGKKSQTSDLDLCVNSKTSENGSVAKWYLVSNRRGLSQEMMTERYTTRFWIEDGIW